MASRYNASISTIGISDKKTADALRRLMENSTWLHERQTAFEREMEVRLARMRKSLLGAVGGTSPDLEQSVDASAGPEEEGEE